MNVDEFLAHIERQHRGHFGWMEHESACWTTNAGGQRSGEPDFSHKCKVHQHLVRPDMESTITFLTATWWKWRVKVVSRGVVFRARGYTKSMEDGKVACEIAVRTLALGIVAQFETEVK